MQVYFLSCITYLIVNSFSFQFCLFVLLEFLPGPISNLNLGVIFLALPKYFIFYVLDGNTNRQLWEMSMQMTPL
uniref:Uncharacterized protein n=1 Tax=Anguilla anguilla TaxID=7936 RepID=A0A0E9XEV7_ANGAN